MQPLHATTEVALVSGAFRRSIPVKEIEHLAETGAVSYTHLTLPTICSV